MIRSRLTVAGILVIAVLVSADLCLAGSLTPFTDQRELWGFRDASGKTVIAPQYDLASEFSAHGIAAVVDKQGWLYIDRQGRPLVRPFVFDNGPDYFQEGLSRYVADGKIGFIDEAGAVVIPAVNDFAEPFSGGLAAVCTGCREERDDEHKIIVGGKWGYMDRTGKIVIPLEYDRTESFYEGQARVVKDGRTLLIDRKGREVKGQQECGPGRPGPNLGPSTGFDSLQENKSDTSQKVQKPLDMDILHGFPRPGEVTGITVNRKLRGAGLPSGK